MTFAEAAMIMMSGNEASNDPRIAKLDTIPTLYEQEFTNGWVVKFKIASDIDNYSLCEVYQGYMRNFVTYWSAYYCYYKNNNFCFAILDDSQFYTKRFEQYSSPAGPGIQFVREISDFIINELVDGASGPYFKGTYKETETYYNYDTGPSPKIETQTYIRDWSNFYHGSKVDRIGAGSILNGTPNDFMKWFLDITGTPFVNT